MSFPRPAKPFPAGNCWCPWSAPRAHSVFSLLDRPLILWDEPAQVTGAADRLWKRLEQTPPSPAYDPARVFFRWDDLQSQAAGCPHIRLEELEVDRPDPPPAERSIFPPGPPLAFHGNMPVAIAEARNLAESGSRVAFFAESTGAVERVADIFNEYGVPYQLGLEQSDSTPEYLAGRAYMAGNVASIYLIRGAVRRGVVFRDAGLAIFGSEDLFDTSELVARAPAGKSALATFSPDLIDLKPGDYVVHCRARRRPFPGPASRSTTAKLKGDYMLLEYAGGAKLYVPLTRMDLVQRFRGAGESAPALDRMGGATWTRTKTRVKAKMRDMADELLKLYASRKMAEGFAFSHDSNWQREFEDAFEFTETRDQLTAIKDIKRDMESPHPMDRLLCGDVGYGKTEVVMRAAFKAMGDGKQVAVLAPNHGARVSTLRNLQAPLSALPRPHRNAQPLPHCRKRSKWSSPIWPKAKSTWSSALTAFCRKMLYLRI